MASKPSSREELLGALEKLARLVGSTPMQCYSLGRYRLCVKLEYVNPTGSHKDRIALYMVKRAIEEWGLRPGGCVAEISSGNTATSVAWVAWRLGLRSLLFVEKHASKSKKDLIRSLGGELVEIGDEGLDRSAAEEEARARGCILLNQMSNDANHLAHYESTAPEIMRQTGGRVDAFVMGVGTAGTVTGVGRRLKEEYGSPLVVSVSPKDSPIVGGSGQGPTIEGLTVSIVPDLYTRYKRYIDKAVGVSVDEALEGVVAFAAATGLLAGPSTGAAFVAATRLVSEGVVDEGSTIVIVAADRLTRYPSVLERLRISGNGTQLLNTWLS